MFKNLFGNPKTEHPYKPDGSNLHEIYPVVKGDIFTVEQAKEFLKLPAIINLKKILDEKSFGDPKEGHIREIRQRGENAQLLLSHMINSLELVTSKAGELYIDNKLSFHNCLQVKDLNNDVQKFDPTNIPEKANTTMLVCDVVGSAETGYFRDKSFMLRDISKKEFLDNLSRLNANKYGLLDDIQAQKDIKQIYETIDRLLTPEKPGATLIADGATKLTDINPSLNK